MSWFSRLFGIHRDTDAKGAVSNRPDKETIAKEFAQVVLPRCTFELLSSGRSAQHEEMVDKAMGILKRKYGLSTAETVEIVESSTKYMWGKSG